MNYTYHVGEKFHEDGSVRAYPGITVICFADSASPIYQAGERVQQQLMAAPYKHKFALLPPSSFHMTIFSLTNDQQREPAYWSSRLPLDTPLVEADQFFISTVPTVPAPPPFRMCMTHLGDLRAHVLTFRLSPADDATDAALYTYRNALADATGVRYPYHDLYPFHLTLAYQLMHLDDEETRAYADLRLRLADELRCEVGVFEPEAPLLTFFDDMFRFEPANRRDTLHSRRETLGS